MEPEITSPKFTPPQLIAPELKAAGVWLIDVDNDGHPDLFHHKTVNGVPEKLAFLWNASGWSSDKSSFHLKDTPPQNPKDIQFAKLENSTRAFVLYWDGSMGSMKTYAAAGTGWQDFSSSLASPVRFTTPNGEDAFVRFVDIAGDGRDDLLCYTQGQPIIQHIYENKGPNGWSAMDPTLVPPLPLNYGGNKDTPHFLTDLDGDGKADILYLSDNSTPSSTYLNRFPIRWQISRDFAPPQALAAAEKYDIGTRFVDFDGDGLTDIIGRYRKKDGTEEAAAWRNNANDLTGLSDGWKKVPSFYPPSPTGWEDEGGDWGSRFIDLNGDGLIDQAFAREGEPRKAWINNGVGSGNDGDAFANKDQFALPTDVTRKDYGGLGVIMVDVNGDGLTDILESRSTTQDIAAATTTFTRKAWINQGAASGGSIWKATTDWLLPIQLSQDMVYMPTENEGSKGWDIPNVEGYPAKAQKLGGRDCAVIVTDLNGDRLPDIAYNFVWKGATITPHEPEGWPQGSIKITRTKKEERGAYINNGHGWDKTTDYTPKHRLDEKEGELRFAELLDVNGDGLPDLVYVGKKTTGENLSETYLNTGTGWTQNPVQEWKIPTLALEAGDGDSGYRILDVNGDGLVDILVHKVDEAGERRKSAFINNGRTWVQDDSFAPPDEFAFAQHGQTDLGVRTVDVNGDGLPDLVQARNAATGSLEARAALLNRSKRSDTLASITNGFDVKWSIGYQSLSEPIGIQDIFSNNSIKPVYEAPSACGAYPILRAAPPAYIVTSISVTEGGRNPQNFRYRYGNFRVNSREARPLGFEWRETWNETQLPTTLPHGMRERSSFHQAEYALAGRSKMIEILVPHKTAGGALSQVRHQFTENTWKTTQRDALPRPDGKPYQIINAILETTHSDSHDLDGTFLGSQTDTFEFDDWGNATKTTTARSDHTKAVTTSTFTNDPVKWFLGRLTRSTTTLTGDGGATITRNAEFAYDPGTGVLVEEVAYAGHPKAVTTSYQYDLFGNKTSSTVSAINVQSRTSKVEFDEKGRFAVKGTNAMGHSSTTKFDPVLGVPIKITDANGVSATTEYDSHGRQTRSISPTGITTATAYNWLPNGTLNGALIEVITQTGALPASKGWLDHKGRPLKAITTGAGGRTIVAETEYDILGRTIRSSDPHFETDPPVFTEYKDYDILNRPAAVRTPDGALTKYRYIGYKTIVTDKLGRVSESETNLRKLPIRIKDAAGGVLRYEYDAADRLVRVFNPDGTRMENIYDLVGHRIQARDPDLGTWSYTYNALGELLSQKDAKGQVTSITYDKLSRPLTRTEADRWTTWQYDSAPHGIGSLAVVKDSEGYIEANQYDNLSRPVATTFTMRGEKFTTSSQLDDYSRIVRLNYPTGFAVENVYDQWGFFTEVKDAKTNHSFWKAEKFNEKGQVLAETFGNGVTSAASFSRTTRFLDHIETKGQDGTAIQELDYTYDLAGNILKRQDHVDHRFEQFGYDNLDQLRKVIQNQQIVATLTYGESGNILKKSDTGVFDYASNAAPAHGVKSIQRPDGSVSQYRYDCNGNMTSGPKGIFEYTAANLVKSVHCGSSSAAFTYSPSGAKYWEEYRDGHLRQETLSIGLYERVNEEMAPPFTLGGDWMPGWQYNMAEQAKPGSFERKLAANERLRHRHYIAGPVGVVAVHEQLTEFFPVQRNLTGRIPVRGKPLERSSRDSWVTAYMHRDALGSIKVLTDSGGNIMERLNYESWGERQELPSDRQTSKPHHTLRDGYTGHEHLDNLGLVHMEARVYDPDIGRFISPDSMIDGVSSAAGYNRFSYVSNNPLRYTDPTGHWGLGSIWNGMKGAAGAVWGGITGVAKAAWEGIKFVGELHWNALKAGGKWIGENWKTIVVVAAVIVISVVAGPLGPVAAGMICGAVSGGLSTALYGGSFSDVMENMVKGAIIGGVAAGAFSAVGDAGLAEGGFEKIAAHSVVGGGMEAAQGGDFWRGALAAGVAQGFAPQIGRIRGFPGDSMARVGAAAALGGTTSALTGSSFSNGAVTGAFSRAFNDEMHCDHFSQTGDTVCYDTATGETIGSSEGYSGQPGYQNDPSTSHLSNRGTIPAGDYSISGSSQTLNGRGHSNVIRLSPLDGTETYGRNNFRIHGDSIRNPGTASHGCIISNPQMRQSIVNHGASGILSVRPTYPQSFNYGPK